MFGAAPTPVDSTTPEPSGMSDEDRMSGELAKAAEGYEAPMRRALELASNGPTGVNPQVGCVLLSPDGTIIAEGWHRGVATPHAEVDALSHLPAIGGVPQAHGLTAVVTLEPCNHTGHTGPCSIALVSAGVARVVYAISDPGQESSGGAQRLREVGIEVISGVLERETTEFLRPWLIATTQKRPFVTLKWASSLDGRTAASDGSSQWITGTASRQRVHEERASHDAIAVGTGTVFADDPTLTARGDGGELLEHQPLPIVIGQRQIPGTAKLWEHPRGVLETGSRNIIEILTWLFEQKIRSLYVEGGPTLASAFVSAGVVDDYSIYLAPKLLGGEKLALGDIGVSSIGEARALTITGVESLGPDILVRARPTAGAASARNGA